MEGNARRKTKRKTENDERTPRSLAKLFYYMETMQQLDKNVYWLRFCGWMMINEFFLSSCQFFKEKLEFVQSDFLASKTCWKWTLYFGCPRFEFNDDLMMPSSKNSKNHPKLLSLEKIKFYPLIVIGMLTGRLMRKKVKNRKAHAY
jgi:hypothetical protein